MSRGPSRQWNIQFSSVQSLNPVWLFATPWIAARQASLSNTNSRNSLRLTSIESVMPSSQLILCCPLLLLPPIRPRIRVFSNESTLHVRWPKYWSFSFSIIPSKEIPGLICYMGTNQLLWTESSPPKCIFWDVFGDVAFKKVQFSSVVQSCLTLCDPMDCSTPGFPVHHQLPEFAQTHVHWVGDAIQPSHPLSSPFSSHLQSFPESGSFPMS